jgi:hypothetical protein
MYVSQGAQQDQAGGRLGCAIVFFIVKINGQGCSCQAQGACHKGGVQEEQSEPGLGGGRFRVKKKKQNSISERVLQKQKIIYYKEHTS